MRPNSETYNPINSVVIIGAGNVAFNLGHALVKSGIEVKQVISRSMESCRALANELSCSFSNHFDDIDPSADLYIISVSDNSVQQVVQNIHLSQKFIVHTAGSIPLSVISDHFTNSGVLYPFQTFSKKRILDFSDIPVCIEANSSDNLKKLYELAAKLSGVVKEINSDERAFLHLAAVFANNYANHMIDLGNRIMQKKNLDFSLLKPLLTETFLKLSYLPPDEGQTGPAVRGDTLIIEKHLKMLDDLPEMKDIYRIIAESIFSNKTKR
jgi:predicted short-subunit dehydrogenase-like oxidoreductase (DUF2520 family)